MFALHYITIAIAFLCALAAVVEPLVVRSSQQPAQFNNGQQQQQQQQDAQLMIVVAKPEQIPSFIRQVQQQQQQQQVLTTTTTAAPIHIMKPRIKQPRYTASEAATKLEQISSIILPATSPLRQRVDEEPIEAVQRLNDVAPTYSVALPPPPPPVMATTMAPANDNNNNKPYYLDMMPSPMDGSQAVRVLTSAVPNVTYPNYAAIPDTSFTCKGDGEKQGFFADPETRCQVYHRCLMDGAMTSYLCPNRTVFNQVTLTCDWFWNVECEKARQQYDYANSQLSVPGAQLQASPPKGYQPAWISKWIKHTLNA